MILKLKKIVYNMMGCYKCEKNDVTIGNGCR